MPDDELVGDQWPQNHPALDLIRTPTGVYRQTPLRLIPEPDKLIEGQIEEQIDELRDAFLAWKERMADEAADALLQYEMEHFFSVERQTMAQTEAVRDPELHPPHVRFKGERPRPRMVDAASVYLRWKRILTPPSPLQQEPATRPAPTPCSKNGYRTKVEARTVINHRQSKGSKRLRAYDCPSCGLWHLTSKTFQRK